MTTLTVTTFLVILYGMFGSAGFGRALALGGATGAGAAFVSGTTAVPTFYAVAVGAAVALAVQFVVGGRSSPPESRALPPGVSLLLLFLAWSTAVTLIAPLLFDGMEVPTTDGMGEVTAGVVSTSNIAQIIYLILGVCVVVFLARSPSARPTLIGLAAGATTLLSLWRTIHEFTGLPFLEGVFDNSPFFAYIETAAGGVQRFRGIMSEPSGLAGSSLVTISYMLARARYVEGWRRWGVLGVAAAAFYLGAISTSATFVVAGGALTVIALLALGLGFLMRWTSISAIVSVVGCVLVIVALWVLPIVFDFVEAAVNEKVSSSSYTERSGADSLSYDIFFDTFGVGVGLGTTRSSSFFSGLLSTTGLVGTLLFAAVVVTLIRRSAPLIPYRPVIWALVALLVLKVVAGPDLSDSTGILWMSLGILSHAVLNANSGRVPVASSSRVSGAPSVAGQRSEL